MILLGSLARYSLCGRGDSYVLFKKRTIRTDIPAIKKTDGTVIPERKYMAEDRAVYKHPRYSRFYRGEFTGVN